MVAGRLPTATSELVGRSADVVALLGMLTGPARLVTLTGPPGVGKTRLALEVATRTAGTFADGVAWLALEHIGDRHDVPAELARALGLERPQLSQPPDPTIHASVSGHVLLVVDNFEHLLDAAPAVGDLLDRFPGLRILATSRQRLNLLAEVEYPVPPLPVPPESAGDDVAGLAANPAVQLLLARAPAHVALDRRTARPLAEICRRMDGLPLAVELAAARLRVFTPGELSFRLDHRSVVLSGAHRDAPARHRTLTAAIEWSHELLPDVERTVFRRLAVLAGEWDVAAAQAVCGLSEPVVLAALESLMDHCLVRRTHTEDQARFAMLASLRDYANDQLVAAGEADATRTRHAVHFARISSMWEKTLGTDAENSRWADFDATHADLAAAFEHLPAGAELAWLGTALAWHAYLHGSLVRSAAALDTLHELADPPGEGAEATGLDDDIHAAVLVAAGVAEFGRGAMNRAAAHLDSAVQRTAANGDERRRCIATSFRGHVARAVGDAALAAELYRSARAMCERLGHVRGTAWSAYDLGLLAVDSDDPGVRAGAAPLLREALTYFDDLDYDWAVAHAARGLATALLDLGNCDEAGRLLDRSLFLHEQVGDRRGTAQCLEGLAQIAVALGSPARAARLVGAAQHDRRQGGTAPSAREQRRLDDLDAQLISALGRAAADHEKHTGRTSPRSAVLSLARDVAVPPATAVTVTLTARQNQVAELIAAGSTNRQIGRALGISEKTAEAHVGAIMTRLNLPSRAGVAAWVAVRSRADP